MNININPYNKNFKKSLCSKKELNFFTSNPDLNHLQTHQQIISNFINPVTPYKSLLVYHETGTGKTCTALSIAESFKNSIRDQQRIIIVASNTVEREFYNNIFNPERDFRCVGTEYEESVDLTNLSNKKQIEAVKKNIQEKYEIMQPTAFKKKIKELHSNGKLNDFFDNNIVIIDEAHNFRNPPKISKKTSKNNIIVDDEDEDANEDNTADYKKKFSDNIKILLQNAVNLRLILLTATPIFDNSEEIAFLCNMLNFYDKDRLVNIKNIADVKDKLTGKVSFLRGGSPKYYPVHLQNSQASLPINAKPFDSSKSSVARWKEKSVLQLTLSKSSKRINTKSYETVTKLDNKKNDSVYSKARQISNYVDYNKFEDDFPFNDYSFKNENKISKSAFLSKCPKIKNCIDIIKKSEGKSLIFSDYSKYGGIFPLIIALEFSGFTHYKYGSLFDSNGSAVDKIESKPTYLIYKPDEALNKIKTESFLSTFNSKSNSNGSKIKVIIISEKGSEGLDLKAIRSTHILNPPFNFGRIEQVIGRGIRFKSHEELDIKKRNMITYYHALQDYDNDRDSIDIHIYKMLLDKYSKTLEFTKLLQNLSIHASNFYEQNVVEHSKNTYESIYPDGLIDSERNNLSIDEFFKHQNSKYSDFDDAEFKCDKKNIYSDTTTFDPEYSSKFTFESVIHQIKRLFFLSDELTFNQIYKKIYTAFPEIDSTFVSFALRKMISFRIPFKNRFDIRGYIVPVNSHTFRFEFNKMYPSQNKPVPLIVNRIKLSDENLPKIIPTKRSLNIFKEFRKEYDLLFEIIKDLDVFQSHFTQKDFDEAFLDTLNNEDRIDILTQPQNYDSFSTNTDLFTYIEDQYIETIHNTVYIRSVESITEQYKVLDKQNINFVNHLGPNNTSSPFDPSDNRKIQFVTFINERGDLLIKGVNSQAKKYPKGYVISKFSEKRKILNTVFKIENIIHTSQRGKVVDFLLEPSNAQKIMKQKNINTILNLLIIMLAKSKKNDNVSFFPAYLAFQNNLKIF